jgi:hypothetical protein
MTDSERIQRIDSLTPRQAVATVQYVTAWLDEQRPEQQERTTEQQIDMLNAEFERAGHAPLPLSPSAKPDLQVVGKAARQVLAALAQSPDRALLDALDPLLAEPPEAETKALLEVAVVSVVLTACIMALGTKAEFEKDERGRTRVKLSREGIAGPDLKSVLEGFYAAVKSLAGMA